MQYREQAETIFETTYQLLKSNNVTFLIGSSMGGYFAYWMAKKLGVPVLLFNPALSSRTHMHIVADEDGTLPSFATVVMGESDDVVSPIETQQWLKSHAKFDEYKIMMAPMTHRVPFELFTKYISLTIPKISA
jgi:hypothetical protein